MLLFIPIQHHGLQAYSTPIIGYHNCMCFLFYKTQGQIYWHWFWKYLTGETMVLGIRKPIVRQTEVIIETESGTKTIWKDKFKYLPFRITHVVQIILCVYQVLYIRHTSVCWHLPVPLNLKVLAAYVELVRDEKFPHRSTSLV